VLAYLFELPTALLEYFDLLQGGCSPSAPPGYHMIVIIKMIEIYNIATCYAAIRINNCLKRTFVVKVATTDNICNKWKPYRKIETFRGEQR